MLLVFALVYVATRPHGHQHAAVTTTTHTRTSPPVTAVIPSPGPVVHRFLGAYTKLYDGKHVSRRGLVNATRTARHQATLGGSLPASYRAGALRLVRVTGLPGPDETTADIVFYLRNRRSTFQGSLSVLYIRSSGWRITHIIAPDFTQASHKQAAPSKTSAGLRASATLFIDRYVGFVEFRGKMPAGSPTIVNEIATNQDPLVTAGLQPDGAHLRSLKLAYGPEQNKAVVVTASLRLSDGTTGTFSVLMHHAGGGWRAESFLGGSGHVGSNTSTPS